LEGSGKGGEGLCRERMWEIWGGGVENGGGVVGRKEEKR